MDQNSLRPRRPVRVVPLKESIYPPMLDQDQHLLCRMETSLRLHSMCPRPSIEYYSKAGLFGAIEEKLHICVISANVKIALNHIKARFFNFQKIFFCQTKMIIRRFPYILKDGENI